MDSVTKDLAPYKEFLSFFNSFFSDIKLRTLAFQTKFIVRSRKMHPELLMQSLVAAFSSDKEFTLSSIYQDYKLRCKELDLPYMSWEPFYDFLQKKEFLAMIKELLNSVNAAALKGKFSDAAKLTEVLQKRIPKLKDILLQDGSEVSTNCSKYKGTKDPQIKIHRTMSLTSMAETHRSVTSGVKSERDEICVSTLKNKLLIADAGYPANHLFYKIDKNGGYFLIKIRTNSAMQVTSAVRFKSDGTVEKQDVILKDQEHRYGEHLKSPKFCDGCNHDFKVKVRLREDESKDCVDFSYRVIKLYLSEEELRENDQQVNIETYESRGKTYRRYFVLLATNLPCDAVDLMQLAELYRARWSIEISFRMLKGFCGFKRTLTKDPTLAKALVYVSELVYALKLLFAQQLEKLTQEQLSPKKTFHYMTNAMQSILFSLKATRKALKLLQGLVEVASKWTKSKCSYINRTRGKAMSIIIDKISQPPILIPE